MNCTRPIVDSWLPGGTYGLGLVVTGPVLACLLSLVAPAHAQEVSEYRLKAAFLYNFAVFTEWPPDTGGSLRLCVYGTDPFGEEIDGLEGKLVGDRLLTVQRTPKGGSLEGCQIVFIAASAISELSRVLDGLRGSDVLTVADSPGALRLGVALNMSVVQSRVAFEANLTAARAAGLNLSSKLLRLATTVIQ
jgi:hypothetical protein